MSLTRSFAPILNNASRSLNSLKSHYRPSSLRLFYPYESICVSCLRRGLQTAAVQSPTPYHPDTLDMPSIDSSPPRNKDAPKNELTRTEATRNAQAGGTKEAAKPPFTSEPVDNRTSSASPSKAAEGRQAPISNQPPSSSPQSTSASTSTKPPTTRKLRPRKAALSLTPLAVSHIRSLTKQTPPKLIRVGVKNRGCSGLAYHLEYISEPGKFDEVVEQDDAKVYIDSRALFSIIGSEMDWVEDKLSARFVFHNPNIKEQCGCGESFMV